MKKRSQRELRQLLGLERKSLLQPQTRDERPLSNAERQAHHRATRQAHIIERSAALKLGQA